MPFTRKQIRLFGYKCGQGDKKMCKLVHKYGKGKTHKNANENFGRALNGALGISECLDHPTEDK